MENMNWYDTLNKPAWNPPAWVFGPVWTVLYIMIGLSLFFFVRSQTELSKVIPSVFFGVQLFLNLIWSLIFFGLKQVSIAFFDLVLLVVFLALTVITFYPISKLAAWLLVPYFIWSCFALFLNFKIWRMN